MPNKPENLLWIDTLCLPLDDKALESMSRVPTLNAVATKLKAALKLGKRHNVGWSFLATPAGEITNVLPRSTEKDAKFKEKISIKFCRKQNK